MTTPQTGAQRLPLEKLHAWEALEYGMFIHFGMATFDGGEVLITNSPSTVYAPTDLDVEQWVRVAYEAGMRYAVLTAKHASGHCLWPSKYTDFDVETSSDTTDVMAAFVAACAKYGIMPGFYYCCWDNHHTFGSLTHAQAGWGHGFTTQEYRDFQLAQVEELITQYGPFGEVWFDIPGLLERDGREKQYAQVARLMPDAVILTNHGQQDGATLDIDKVWPTDIMTMERYLPYPRRRDRWYDISLTMDHAERYYIPGEFCGTIGGDWFHIDGDAPRSAQELLGEYLVTRARGCNVLLNVPPDRSGRLPQPAVETLYQLRKLIDLYR